MKNMLSLPLIELTVSNTSFRFKDTGAGETILGYRTRKVRTWYSSTVEMVMMVNQKTVGNDSKNQWIANVDFDPRTMETWAKSFASGMKSIHPELARELAT
jgi:hypothetical protein